MKPIIKKADKSIEPNKNSDVFKRVKKWIKRALIASLIAGAATTSLVSCSQEIPEPYTPAPIVVPEEQEVEVRENRYELSITNLTQEEMQTIVDEIPSAFSDYTTLKSYTTKEGRKYMIEIKGIENDDELLSLVSNVNVSNAKFNLETNSNKIYCYDKMTKEDVQYLLDNAIVKNASLEIRQNMDKKNNFTYYNVIMEDLDLDDFELASNVFKTINKETSSTTDHKALNGDYDVSKNEFLSTFLNQNYRIEIDYYVDGGAYHDLDKLFNLSNNPNLWYRDGYNWIQATATENTL